MSISTNNQLIKHLEENTQVLRTPEIKKAFEKIDRTNFVDFGYKSEAYEDYPLPIGFGQTISQPTTVAFMLELLKLKIESKTLDVGSGSGYTTALIASIASKGSVLGLEIIPELVKKGHENLAKYNFSNARIIQTIGDFSEIKEKFDRILINAAAEEVPKNLVRILAPGGTMVVPVKQSVFKISKQDNGKIETLEYPGFVFVPLQ